MSERTNGASDARDASLPRIVVFSDDWGRHASSCQHLISSLLPRYRVDWVETIGTRTPSLSKADFQRGVSKLRSFFGPKAKTSERVLPQNLRIVAPRMLPSFASDRRRRINAWLLQRGLAHVLDPSDPPLAVITTAPIVADLAARTPYLHWVYYCVDALDEWPGLDGETLYQMEVEMLPHMQRVLVVSEVLRARMAQRGIVAPLLTHGVDLARWAVDRSAHRAAQPPKTLFWGHADERLHEGICLALAEATELTFVGPRGNVAPALAQHPRIHWQGSVDFDELPRFAAAADVLVMPYADSEATRNMQPLKLKEYLATGLPTVVTPLPANLFWSHAMDVVDTPQAFVARVLERAQSGLPADQARAREALRAEGWDQKVRILEEAIHAR
ncbi:MAG: glycosyltransferase [Planctomycetes bacterium]|nr:glycosyltransferase [Planctomycetota bacterium]MCB9912983.1 glycosyltransferase [Planctomycetota bacterium]